MPSKLDIVRSRAAATVERNRNKIKMGVYTGEVLLASAASGYVSEMKAEVGGVPTDAALGLLLIGGGLGMSEPHLLALGIGFAAGYMRDMGRTAAQGGLANVLPFAVGA